ncbi:CCHC-type domain-containing protein [Trichonephila inaurata madagascariensis]|uniref:CCHC-type domain-containing protein n=1 Tax=Trichonephila inaurata madagascariensis TaxID=2747483 RepID=A0A8X6IQ00_9ARAC|nr:CCHC-type domain-containing protein [Trichonephila inaurata madagascariensis]GFY78898.1 CCHC-type domain-containing protein [Trichonephila inaurata madagascariensis]
MGWFFILLHASCKDRCLSKGSYRSEGMHTVTGGNGQLKILIRNRGPIETFMANSFCLKNREGSFYLRGQMRRSTRLQHRDISSTEEAANCLTPPQRLFVVFLAATIINQE